MVENTVRALVVGSFNDSIAKAQLDPFIYNRRHLNQQLKLKVSQAEATDFVTLGNISKTFQGDLIFLMPSWQASLQEEGLIIAEKVLLDLREHLGSKKLIFIDPFAQTSSNYFRLLPYVDVFLKRQCYKNLDDYQQSYIGGSQFTDFLAKQWQFDFSNWFVGSEVNAKYLERIQSGWNLGTSEQFIKSLKPPLFRKNSFNKELDIFCRLSLASSQKKEWYYHYRQTALEAIKPLDSDYKVVFSGRTEESLVSRRQYLQEIKKSRIVFSPFGWGETCWRDFEAICYDCLLIKPSMSHIKTEPNIFVEGKTYVPVKWDFSDLEEKCRYFLNHPDESATIVKNARQAYTEYFQEKKFIDKIKSLME
ncbi:glycosyltransferase [Chroococcus sp. FPU101]|uniref:glycosyltransferase n=1 Tax=Chroococcus sp. FPU101 TaxID=1974212 RepID=UPI001A8DAC78|nr:glycosyltransferase [Chroococcus sp. FPU101]GFE70026.1 hypothetical protein CFPU101_26360 [Chroococcus sp. FPU101]